MNFNKLNIIAGVAIVLLYGLLINLPYFHLREFQGEEARRVVIAEEMLRKQDYILPTFEGEIYLNKPPLFNWLLALVFKYTGNISEVTARSVSIFNTVLLAIILSLFWKKFYSKGIWVLPGLIFLSIPNIMEKAIKSEIDITFTLTVTVSIFSWFYLSEVKRNYFLSWIISLLFLSISVLTKGIISIFFFYLTVGLYLIFKRRLGEFFSIGHLFGIIFGYIIFSLWFIPLSNRVSPSQVFSVWIQEVLIRKEPLGERNCWIHIFEFPLYFIFGYMPWIGFLFFFRTTKLRENEELKNIITFSLPPLIIVFLILWIIPGARVRYFLPLSGLLSISIAGILEIFKDEESFAKNYTKIIGLFVFLLSISIPFLSKKFNFTNILPWVGGLFILVCACFLFFLKNFQKRLIVLFFIILAGKTLWAGIYFPYHRKNMSYYKEAALRIKERVPKFAKLYDYNLSNSQITFYLKRDVRKIKDLSALKKGDYFLMGLNIGKENEISLPCIFKEIDKFKSHKILIKIFRKEEKCL